MAAPSLLASLRTLGPITQAFADSYASTPARLKILDAYSAAAAATAVVLFVYAKLVGSFPFNVRAAAAAPVAALQGRAPPVCARGSAAPPARASAGLLRPLPPRHRPALRRPSWQPCSPAWAALC